MEGQLPKYFCQEICFSGGKQTIHKVSAAFIVKNYHPRTSLSVGASFSLTTFGNHTNGYHSWGGNETSVFQAEL